jgi:hypothetical protein
VTVTTETRPLSALQCDGIFDSEKKGRFIFPGVWLGFIVGFN